MNMPSHPSRPEAVLPCSRLASVASTPVTLWRSPGGFPEGGAESPRGSKKGGREAGRRVQLVFRRARGNRTDSEPFRMRSGKKVPMLI